MPPVRNWRVGRVDQFTFWFRWSIYVLVVWALNAGRFRKHTRLKHSSADMLLYGSGSWRDVAQGARRSHQRAKWKATNQLCSIRLGHLAQGSRAAVGTARPPEVRKWYCMLVNGIRRLRQRRRPRVRLFDHNDTTYGNLCHCRGNQRIQRTVYHASG